MSTGTGGNSGKGLFALLAVIVVAAGVALGIYVWPMLSDRDEPTAAAGYVSAKDASAKSSLTSSTRAPRENDEEEPAAAETSGDSVEPTRATTEAASNDSDDRDEEQSSDREEVASNNNTARNSGGGGLCDGRAVLILHSVVDYGNAQSEINAALAQHPGTQVLQPGACSSLRASLDGHQIYAIVRDYGSDVATLCRDAAVQGGNPRTLNNNADFASPCG